MSAKIQPCELTADLIAVSRQIGHTPLVTEYEYFGKYSPTPIRKTFGSWKNALQVAGLSLTQEHRILNTNSDITNELERVTELLGHAPSFTELKQNSSISPDTFARRIGKSNFASSKDLLTQLNPNWNVDFIGPEIGGWVAGFVCGEGSFIVRAIGSVGFTICQRADDAQNLEIVRSVMDIPKEINTYSNSYRRIRGELAGDEARLTLNNRWICKARVVPFFTRFQIHGRKGLDFAIFKDAVEYLCQRDEKGYFRKRYSPDEKAYLTNLANKLQSLRHDPSSLAP